MMSIGTRGRLRFAETEENWSHCHCPPDVGAALAAYLRATARIQPVAGSFFATGLQ